MRRLGFAFIVVATALEAACGADGSADGSVKAGESSEIEGAVEGHGSVIGREGTCWCDSMCSEFGDCCAEASICVTPPEAAPVPALAPVGATCTSNASCQSNVCLLAGGEG